MSGSYAIDVVVPVYNAPEDLRRCVASVLAHTRPGYRLVLFDDAGSHPLTPAPKSILARQLVEHIAQLLTGKD